MFLRAAACVAPELLQRRLKGHPGDPLGPGPQGPRCEVKTRPRLLRLLIISLFVFREHHNFLKLCLRLLSNHLALALAGGVATSILGRQARPLRNLLFRLMDSSVPDEIQEVRRAKTDKQRLAHHEAFGRFDSFQL